MLGEAGEGGREGEVEHGREKEDVRVVDEDTEMRIKETESLFGDGARVAGIERRIIPKRKVTQKQWDVLCTRCASLNSG